MKFPEVDIWPYEILERPRFYYHTISEIAHGLSLTPKTSNDREVFRKVKFITYNPDLEQAETFYQWVDEYGNKIAATKGKILESKK